MRGAPMAAHPCQQVKGTSQEQAKQEYIALLAKDEPNWEQHPALKDYTEE